MLEYYEGIDNQLIYGKLYCKKISLRANNVILEKGEISPLKYQKLKNAANRKLSCSPN